MLMFILQCGLISCILVTTTEMCRRPESRIEYEALPGHCDLVTCDSRMDGASRGRGAGSMGCDSRVD